MDDSDVGAVVVLPEGFAASLATDEPLPVEVLVDSGATVPGVVARAVAAGIGARLDAVRLAVVSAAALGAAPLDADELAGLEPAVSLDRRETGEISPAATVAPGMGLLFLYFTVGGVARGLLEEGRTRLLDRVRAAPATLAAVLYGKGIAVVALGLVSLASLWGASTVLLGADWGDPAGVALVVVAATLAVGGIASVIAGTASNEQSADLTATFVAFVLGILGGSLVPLSELPDAMTRLARFTPNGWAQDAFAELSAGGAGVVDVLPEVAVLLAWAVVTAALGLALLPRRLGAR
jgi:ABC-2 type transport system permease protein